MTPRALSIAVLFLLATACGQDEPAPSRPSTPKKPAAAPPPGWQRKLTRDSPLPDIALAGRIAGRPFRPDKVTLDASGKLELRQGRDFFPELAISVWIFKLQTPHKLFVSPDDGHGVPHVWRKHRPQGSGVPQSKSFLNDYALRLELDPETDGFVEGRIHLCLPDHERSWVAGRFKAEVTGKLRIVGGKPDLSVDSFPTLQHVIRRHLVERHAGKKVEVSRVTDGTYSHASKKKGGPPQWGSGTAHYKVDGGPPQIAKLLLVKKTPKSEWTVREMLAPHQLALAHPLSVPAAGSSAEAQYVAARWLEAELARNHAGKLVRSGWISPSTNRRRGWGQARLRCQVAGQAVERTVRLALRDGRWSVAGELPAGKIIDYRTGQVVDRPRPKRPKATHRPQPKPRPAPPAELLRTIPTHPARGALRGKPFAVEQARLSGSRTLSLRQGKDPRDPRYIQLELHLSSALPGAVAGQTLYYPREGQGHPSIHLRQHKPGNRFGATTFYGEGYRLLLVLGPVVQGAIEARLDLVLFDADKSQVRGTLRLPVTWFREAAPDLRVNDPRTLQHVARKALAQRHPGRLSVLRAERLTYGGGSGSGILHYQAGGKPTFAKFLFVKRPAGWQVARMLRKDEVPQAHPLELPTEKSWAVHQVQFVAGRWLERQMQSRHTGKGFVVERIWLQQGPGQGVGTAQVAVRLEDGKTLEWRLLVRQRPGGAWMVARPLADGEQPPGK